MIISLVSHTMCIVRSSKSNWMSQLHGPYAGTDYFEVHAKFHNSFDPCSCLIRKLKIEY